MDFVINAEQLRKALKDIEAAEKNGFNYCEAVFKLASAGQRLDDCKAEYSDLCEKAHPTNGSLDWGRFQGVTKINKFIDGKLVRIVDKSKIMVNENYKVVEQTNNSKLFSEFVKVWGNITKTNDPAFIKTCFKYTSELKDILPKINKACKLQARQFSDEIEDSRDSEIAFERVDFKTKFSCCNSALCTCGKKIIKK